MTAILPLARKLGEKLEPWIDTIDPIEPIPVIKPIRLEIVRLNPEIWPASVFANGEEE